MSVQNITGLRAQKLARKRIEILRSAAEYFKRKSYHGTTMEDISRRLLMTKGSLYYYFKNKEEILYFCHDYSLDLLLDNLKAVESADVRTEDKLRRLIEGHVLMMLDELKGSAMTLDFDALSPALRARVVRKRDRYERALRALIRRGMDERVFPPRNPKLMGFAILGAINWVSAWYSPAGELDSATVAATFADYLVAGLTQGVLAPARFAPGGAAAALRKPAVVHERRVRS